MRALLYLLFPFLKPYTAEWERPYPYRFLARCGGIERRTLWQ